MRQASRHLQMATQGKGLTEITDAVCDWVHQQGFENGLLTLWCPHTSASLTVQENADPTVRADITGFFEQLVPEERGRYRHDSEGGDDMPAHLRSMLTNTQLSIPLLDGRLTLGTWQGIYLFEHRRRPHQRQVILHLLGE